MTRRVRGPLDGPLPPYGPGFESALSDQGYVVGRFVAHMRAGAPGELQFSGGLTAVCHGKLRLMPVNREI
jgi:hypothetical protein